MNQSIPGLGISSAKSNISSFLDLNRMKVLVEEELSKHRNYPVPVTKYSDMIDFLNKYSASAERMVNRYYMQRGNLTQEGWVVLGKRKEDGHYSIIVADYPGELSMWSKRDSLPEDDRTRLDHFLKIGGVIHRQFVIKRIVSVLGCGVEGTESIEDEASLKINPENSMRITRRGI